MTVAASQRVEHALAGVAIFAHQPASLASLYADILGRRLDRRVHTDGREHWILALGGVQLEIKALRTADGERTSDAVGTEQAAGGTSRAELSLTVPDARAAFERAIELGCTPNQAPEQHSWGTFATVIDPEGNRLGLYTPPSTPTTEGRA